MTYGDVMLDEDEEEALKLRPEFAMYKDIEMKEMDRWHDRMEERMSHASIKKFLLERYVDDVNFVVQELGVGMRYHEGMLRWREEWEDEDLANGRNASDITCQAVLAIANSINEDLEFTVDMPSQNKDGRVPMLDLEVWSQEGEEGEEQLRWAFYEKPMASKLVSSNAGETKRW